MFFSDQQIFNYLDWHFFNNWRNNTNPETFMKMLVEYFDDKPELSE